MFFFSFLSDDATVTQSVVQCFFLYTFFAGDTFGNALFIAAGNHLFEKVFKIKNCLL